MSAKRGRLEAHMYFASALTVSATNAGGGPTVVTVAAGTYTLVQLCLAFENALNGDRPDGWTVTPSVGESGTAAVTIACSSSYSLTWTSTDLAAALGFVSDAIVSQTTVTGDERIRSLWMPDCPFWSAFGPQDAGRWESDQRQVVSPDGYVSTLVSSKRRVLDGLRWEQVSRARSRTAAESGLYNSWESWHLYTQIGDQVSYMLPGSKVRFYWDADNDSVYDDYFLLGLSTDPGRTSVDSWNGRFRIEIPRMIVDPGSL